MDQQYELRTHEVEDVHWWYRGRRRVIREALRALDLPRGIEILDAGCGSGRNMLELAELGSVTGLELAEASVEAARARGVGEVVAGSVEEMPFDDNSFDLGVSFDVIEHLADEHAALHELRRVVKSGGYLLVTVPAYQWLWSDHDIVNHHYRRYTRASLERAAHEAGWQTISTTHFNSLLLPAAIAARLTMRWRHSDEPVSDLERTPGGRINATLEKPLRLEARLIGAGRRIPAGLSLLAVFR
jgi:SAM-dependent methyltransferase